MQIKHVTTRQVSHETNDVENMKKRICKVTRMTIEKHDENEMKIKTKRRCINHNDTRCNNDEHREKSHLRFATTKKRCESDDNWNSLS